MFFDTPEYDRTYSPNKELYSSAKPDCPYTVGISQDGSTVLRIESADSFTSISLTMNEAATRQLIRLLESTLPLESNEQFVPSI